MYRAVSRLFIVFVLVLHCNPLLAGEKLDLLWQISKEGQQRGYLLGTIHSEDPRVLEYSPQFLEQLKSCDRFAMELVPDMATLSKLAQVMLLPEDQDLETLIGADRFQSVAKELSRYGVPGLQLGRMKPWAAMMTLSVPPPKTGLFMDFALSLRASGYGLDVVGLETLEEQLKFMEEMPLDQQIEMLDKALEDADLVQDVHDRMVDSYLRGDLNVLLDETESQLSELGAAARAHFLREGIEARNHRMFESLQREMALGNVFAAVGALHLPGEEGLIALLRAAGYELLSSGAPFADPAD